MENKHTQGTFYAKDGQIIIEETGKTIAVIPYFDNESEEQKANQQLFAASLKMLKTLQTIKEEAHKVLNDSIVKGNVDTFQMLTFIGGFSDIASAAIDKATK